MRPRDALDRPTDLVIAELAAVQHGRVASWQLALAGVTPTELRRRAQAGRLHREFRGVYAVGTPVVAGRPYEANVLLSTPFGELRVDAYWREYGFGVELDS